MTTIRSLAITGLGCAAVLALAVSARAGDPPAAAKAAPAAKMASAVAELKPTQGNSVNGRVMFTLTPEGVRVMADILGLTPGEHGFHIHEKGDCSAPDALSAGPHFNPGGKPHGAPGVGEHHTGDLGNVTAGRDGRAHLDALFPFLTLTGPDSIIGRGLIVHASPDDLKTQPTGNAGGRQACGVIKAE